MHMKSNISTHTTDDLAYLVPNDCKQMEVSCKPKNVIFICVILAICGILGFGYFCPEQVCALSTRLPLEEEQSPKAVSTAWMNSRTGLSYDQVMNENFAFDLDSNDVMVFLHMQKTGGTSFGKHLVHDLELRRPCTCPKHKKRCYCFRPNSNQSWLFSRYTTGWRCGLHADWTELTACVDEQLDMLEGHQAKRRYFYITLIREPVARYLSEFRHVQRGATWKGSRHLCRNRPPTASELPSCYEGDSWEGVTLEEFAGCEWNLASNRQTRMLADLELVGCYNRSAMSTSERERVMLASAKHNLESMAYFGLTEYQRMSQYIFEETFNLRFAVPFEQNNATVSSLTISTLTPRQREQIRHLNALDIELYAFAKKLLFERFDKLKTRDQDFEERFSKLGQTGDRPGFSWSQLEDDVSE